MNFLNGLKTIIGVVGSVITIVIPKFTPVVVNAVGDQVLAVAQGVFGLLLTLGIVHKVEKSQNGK